MRAIIRTIAACAAIGLWVFPAGAQKLAKPGGGAMDLDVLRARVWLRLFSEAARTTVFKIDSSGTTFIRADGSQELIPFRAGYCGSPGKASGSKGVSWSFPAFPILAWADKAPAEDFCKAWNRLVYAAAAGTVEEGLLPPGDPLRMTTGIARATLRQLIQRRHFVSYEVDGGHNKFSGLTPDKQIRLLDITKLDILPFSMRIEYRHERLVHDRGQLKPVSMQEQAVVLWDTYMVPASVVSADTGSFWMCGGPLFAWKDRHDAERFCDARNRLTFGAATGFGYNPFALFAEKAKAWRMGIKPAPSAEWERHRVLAEHAFQEKDYFTALEHYEGALREFMTWPEGWFNAALLYEAVGEFDFAINRMENYLLLVPDAPDAKAAQEKLIVWREKVRR